MSDKIPVTIFTGFLGAGKTTLIANLLKQCQGSRIVVLVNEFGAVSIDGQALGKLSVPRRIEVIALNSPLIAYGGDTEFAEVLEALLARPAAPDHLIIETSGLAVPTAVIETIRRPQFAERLTVDATLDVVDTPLLLDAPTAPVQDAAAEVFALQLGAADVVVLNKVDQLTDQQLIEAETAVRKLAPSVRFIELAYHGQLNPRVALGLRLNQTVASTFAHELVAVAAHGHADGHKHSGIDAHEHGLSTHTHIHEHDPGWMSFALTCHQPVDRDLLQSALEKLVTSEPVVRLKGTVHSDGEHVVVHGVRERIELRHGEGEHSNEHDHDHGHHDHHDHDHHDHHDHSHTHHHGDGEIVFIGYHLNRARVTEILSTLTGTNWE